VVMKLKPGKRLDESSVEQLTEHITTFSLAALKPFCTNKK